jgi:DNA polymerase I-like protein with 3'-5' exonuclease and polymerase domains
MKIVLDIETNSTHDKIWCVVCRDLDTDIVSTFTQPNNLQQYLDSVEKIIAHNGIFFDFPVLKKIWNIQVKKSQVIDTLVLARLYNPSIEDGHSLEAWGQRLGYYKAPYKQIWSWMTGIPLTHKEGTKTIDDSHLAFDQPVMSLLYHYCVRDTLVTAQLYKHLEREMKDDFSEKSKELEHQVAIIIAEQERNGFKLDERGATELLCSLKAKLEAHTVALQSIFPPKVESNRVSKNGRDLDDIVTPFNPGSRQQIAERLQEKGWKPSKRTEKGSVIVDETTLEGIDIPEAKAIAEYLMLQKRIAQIESWLSSVASDGRVHGRVITSGAITFRATHMSPNMAQVPASKKPYGHECRALWTVEEGNVLVGCDLSGIELRCFAHYLKDEEYSYAICEGKSELGTDVHTRNQKAFGCQTRDQAKTILYATLYGASPGKVGTIIGGTERDGKRIIDNFTKSVPAFKQLKDRIKAFTKNGKIQGLGGYTVQVRSEHSSLNTLLQSAGAIIAKQWIVEFTVQLRKKKIPYKLVGWIHDEVQIETKPEYAEELGNIVVESAKKAGELLNFRVPVGAEFKVGTNWSHTH